MLLFLQQNLATILIATVLVCIVALAIRNLVKEKRGNLWGCSCSCQDCPGVLLCRETDDKYQKSKALPAVIKDSGQS